MTDGWRVLCCITSRSRTATSPPARTSSHRCSASPAHTEEGPGFVERMYPAGARVPADPRGHRGRRGPASSWTSVARVCTTSPSAWMPWTPPLVDLRERGVRLDRRGGPRPAGWARSVAFLHPSAAGGVLVELVQDPEGGDANAMGEIPQVDRATSPEGCSPAGTNDAR